MVRRTFVWAEDADRGGWGWLLSTMPGFDPASPMGVAHDCLEHFNATDDSIEGELQAFGSILYIRGQEGYFNRQGARRTFADTICDELAEFIIKAGWSVKPCKDVRLADEVEELLEDLPDLFANAIDEPWECYRGGQELPTTQEIADVSALALAWMRKGYRRAENRWKNYHSSFDVCELFIAIEGEVEKLGECEPGDKLTVSFSVKEFEYTVNHRPLYNHDW